MSLLAVVFFLLGIHRLAPLGNRVLNLILQAILAGLVSAVINCFVPRALESRLWRLPTRSRVWVHCGFFGLFLFAFGHDGINLADDVRATDDQG